MPELFNDNNTSTGPEHRHRINTRLGGYKNSDYNNSGYKNSNNKNNATGITKRPNPDTEKAWALMWARKFIKREAILTGDSIEQTYCSLVYRYIHTHGFNAETLCVTQTHFARVVRAGKKLLPDP